MVGVVDALRRVDETERDDDDVTSSVKDAVGPDDVAEAEAVIERDKGGHTIGSGPVRQRAPPMMGASQRTGRYLSCVSTNTHRPLLVEGVVTTQGRYVAIVLADECQTY